MKKKDLQEATGLSSSSITKLAKDEYVSLFITMNGTVQTKKFLF